MLMILPVFGSDNMDLASTSPVTRSMVPPILSLVAAEFCCPLNATVIGRCYLDRVVYQSGIAETLNSASGKVDDKAHRNWLLLVRRSAPSRCPLTGEGERRRLLRQSSNGEAALH